MLKGKSLKRWALFVAVLMITTCANMFNATSEILAIPNYSNMGFESGVTSWRGYGNFGSVSNNAHTGSYAGRLNGSTISGLEQIVTGLSPNTQYTVKAWLKTTSGNVSLGVTEYGDTQIAIPTTSLDYIQLSITFTTGPSNTTAKIFFWKGDSGYGYADDFTISQYMYTNLVGGDEFNGSSIDTNNWGFDIGGHGWGNNELQYYTNRPENARIENGNLVIEARKENYMGNSYTSARLISKNKRTYSYGRIAARIWLPYGKGIWPAFWALGNNIDSVGWPKCGEIDIMEMIGGGEGYDDTVYGNVHYDDNGGHAQAPGGAIQLSTGNYSDGYHEFSVEWNSSVINWYMDGYRYYSLPVTAAMDEFKNNPQYILLNLAVGGNWPGNPDETTVFPQKMHVDWVRIYQ